MARNTETSAKWDSHTVEPGIWREIENNMKYEKYTLCDLYFGRKTEKRGKCVTITVYPGVWRETLKNV